MLDLAKFDRTPPKAVRSTKVICCDIPVLLRHFCLNFPCDIWQGNRCPNRYLPATAPSDSVCVYIYICIYIFIYLCSAEQQRAVKGSEGQ